eukprot:1140712-Pelagomonas_calceolata.AAC.2
MMLLTLDRHHAGSDPSPTISLDAGAGVEQGGRRSHELCKRRAHSAHRSFFSLRPLAAASVACTKNGKKREGGGWGYLFPEAPCCCFRCMYLSRAAFTAVESFLRAGRASAASAPVLGASPGLAATDALGAPSSGERPDLLRRCTSTRAILFNRPSTNSYRVAHTCAKGGGGAFDF